MDPCEDCITYGICKAQVQPYIKLDSSDPGKEIWLTLTFFEMAKKCYMIRKYVESKKKRGIFFADNIHIIMEEIFGDKDESMC